MAKITRATQKLFGSTGADADFGQFGSLAASAPVNTKDPATIQGLAAFLSGWAGAVTAGETPTLEETNSLFLLAFQQIAYILQAGVAEYDAATTYYIGSYCQVSGILYVSLQDNNTGNAPASSAAYWQQSGSDPVGRVSDHAGSSAPAGYLVCDGAAISRTAYANLFAVIGTAFGVGDNSTTFNIPNLKGLVTVGYDAAQTEFNAVGKTGGAKTHTLTTPEMPAHTHNVLQGNAEGGGQGVAPNSNQNGSTPATSSTGGGTAHNNLQPYVTMLKIIKY